MVNFGATFTAISLSFKPYGLIILPISAGIACGLSFDNELEVNEEI